MIILLTGVPGSGKSLFAVEMAEKFIAEGRPVYTDIDGYERAFYSPDDWRKCPQNSVVYYDECQKRFPSGGRGRSHNDLIRDMETHRHLGIDLVLMTQDPSLLHTEIRRLVGRHHHFLRMYGLEKSKIFTRDACITDPLSRSQLNQCDQRFWDFPKKLYPLYISAHAHTHKAYVPSFVKKAVIGSAICLLLIGVMLSRYHPQRFLFPYPVEEDKDAVVQVSTETRPGEILPSAAPAAAPAAVVEQEPYVLQPIHNRPNFNDRSYLLSVAACLRSGPSCRCYDSDFFRIDLSQSECEYLLSRMPIYRRSGGGFMLPVPVQPVPDNLAVRG